MESSRPLPKASWVSPTRDQQNREAKSDKCEQTGDMGLMAELPQDDEGTAMSVSNRGEEQPRLLVVALIVTRCIFRRLRTIALAAN